MRSTSVLDSLFPKVRQGILAATLTAPDKWWYLSELAGFIRTRPSSLQRELRTLVQSGILEQRRDGRRVYFKAETRSPVFSDLRGVLEKTGCERQTDVVALLGGLTTVRGDGANGR